MSRVDQTRSSKSGDTTDEDQQKLAEAIACKMFSHDKAAQAMGMKLETIGPGHASVSMTIREDMLNGFGIGHGGITFALGDTAFAYACNSRNEQTVALSCTITYSLAVKLGDLLIAVAKEQVLNKRTGLYDIVVSNQHGEKVAFFRGNSYCTKRKAFLVD